MKKTTKKILCAALCLSAITATSASAAAKRDIRDLNFNLPAYQSVVTTAPGYKTQTNAPWAVNITWGTNVSNGVDAVLINSAGAARSEYRTVYAGTKNRKEINSWGSASYYYSAKFMNSTSSKFSGYIAGTWSPDNKQY